MNDVKRESSVVDGVFDVGEAWASYGLKVAELALTARAKTLTSVSKMLGNMADELRHESGHHEVIETHGVER